MKNQELVTVYHSAAFGVQKIECTMQDYGTKKYAQYDNAPFVHFVQKGKRKPAGFVQGYNPYIIILKGINHPSPADAFTEKEENASGLMCSSSMYGSFDERYKTEFDSKIEEYLKTQTVLMDVRHTVKTNIINK